MLFFPGDWLLLVALLAKPKGGPPPRENLRTIRYGAWVIEIWGKPGAWNYRGLVASDASSSIQGGASPVSGSGWPDALTAESEAKKAVDAWKANNP